MNLALLSALLSDLSAIIDEAQDKPQIEIPETRKLEARVWDALRGHPRLGEVAGHLSRGSASSAFAALNEIQAAAQTNPNPAP